MKTRLHRLLRRHVCSNAAVRRTAGALFVRAVVSTRHALSRAHRTHGVALASLATLIAVASCAPDKVTEPLRLPTPVHGQVFSTIPNDSSLRAQESPQTASTHLTIQPDGGGWPYPVIGTYPTRTIVHAEITGSASAAPWPNPWEFTPTGYLSNCAGWQPTVSNAWSECSSSPYLAVTGSPALLASLPLPAGCGQYPSPPCPTFSGGFDAKLDRLDATIQLSPTDTTLHVGGSAIIGWKAVPDSLGGMPTPTTFMRGYYDPDTTGWPADSAIACVVIGNTCHVTPHASGTVHLWIMVNGKLEHKTAHVTVPPLVLTADPQRGHPGQLVTFTPSWADGTAITTSVNWDWKPDGPTAQTSPCGYSGWNYVCKTNVYESGTMTVFVSHLGVGLPAKAHVTIYTDFRLDADKSSVYYGDTVSFTPKFDGVAGPAAKWRWDPADTSTDRSACPAQITVCRKEMHGPGTMWAFSSTTAGQGDSASKSITVQMPELWLRADRQSGPVNRVVSFLPMWSDGRPVTRATWSWTPDTLPGQTAACSGNPATCQTTVKEYGTMTVEVDRGGRSFTTSVHVTTVPCPTGDSILDNADVREGLANLFYLNHAPNVDLRREQMASVWIDTTSGAYQVILQEDLSLNTPCSDSGFVVPNAPPNSMLLTIMHNHPIDPLTDIVAPHTRCNPGPFPARTGRHGLSPDDMGVANEGWPVFAIDRDSVYRGDAPSAKHSWSRSGTCGVVPPMGFSVKPRDPRFRPSPRPAFSSNMLKRGHSE